MNNFKKKKMESSHKRFGDTLEAIIRDSTRRPSYKNKFNINDDKALIMFLSALEKWRSGKSIAQLLNERIKVGEWW